MANLYIYTNGDIIINTYINDLLLISINNSRINQVLKTLNESFKVKDLSKISRFLSVDIKYDE